MRAEFTEVSELLPPASVIPSNFTRLTGSGLPKSSRLQSRILIINRIL